MHTYHIVRVNEPVDDAGIITPITEATGVVNQWTQAGWELFSVQPLPAEDRFFSFTYLTFRKETQDAPAP